VRRDQERATRERAEERERATLEERRARLRRTAKGGRKA
jgi:hypothetical protein